MPDCSISSVVSGGSRRLELLYSYMGRNLAKCQKC
jgi:hypothetical protein